MTEKRYLAKTCWNCANVQIISYGWGKQKVEDCKGRDIRTRKGKCCDVFMPSSFVKFWLKHNPDYQLLTVDEIMELVE